MAHVQLVVNYLFDLVLHELPNFIYSLDIFLSRNIIHFASSCWKTYCSLSIRARLDCSLVLLFWVLASRPNFMLSTNLMSISSILSSRSLIEMLNNNGPKKDPLLLLSSSMFLSVVSQSVDWKEIEYVNATDFFFYIFQKTWMYSPHFVTKQKDSKQGI